MILIIIIAVLVGCSVVTNSLQFSVARNNRRGYFLPTSCVFGRVTLDLLLPVSFHSIMQAEGPHTKYKPRLHRRAHQKQHYAVIRFHGCSQMPASVASQRTGCGAHFCHCFLTAQTVESTRHQWWVGPEVAHTRNSQGCIRA